MPLTNPAIRVTVVTVNYRTGSQVLESLSALENELDESDGLRVVVVDNDSGDGSFEAIRAALGANGWWPWVDLVASPTNGGFSYGNNLAISQALAGDDPPDLVWLLNPDATVKRGTVKAMREFFIAHPEVGIAGTGVELPDGAQWPYAFKFPTVLGEFAGGMQNARLSSLLRRYEIVQVMNASVAQPVEWVAGMSMMVRREVFEAIGLLDDGYFLYFEETDFCLRARRAGWTCWYVPWGRVVHQFGQSTGVSPQSWATHRLPPYWFESRARYFRENHGYVYWLLADLARIAGSAIQALGRKVRGRPSLNPPHYLRDAIVSSALLRRRPLMPGQRAPRRLKHSQRRLASGNGVVAEQACRRSHRA